VEDVMQAAAVMADLEKDRAEDAEKDREELDN
jgi:hypothetical protein